eukprot:GHVR01109746.1.p4 GENE.GHVR01109746.1~~GHVR01109746.1.p4  ORF type:complete len:110 (+),score=14.57 GHVR01109746.1:926-1255(+)
MDFSLYTDPFEDETIEMTSIEDVRKLISENNEVNKREINVQMSELKTNIEQRLQDISKERPKTVEEEINLLVQNQQNERVQMGRIAVEPTFLIGQVGGEMTLGYLALLL